MYDDQYAFYKELKSKRLLVAFVEYMFEDVEPVWLNKIEKVVRNSLKIRMENQKKKSDAWSQSHWGWRKKIKSNTSSELSSKNNTKTTEQTTKEQQDKDILSNDNILRERKEIWDNKLSHKESEDAFMNVWNSIPTAKWWNEKEWRKMYEQKIQNWMSWEMMYKLASLSKFEIREKVKEIMYSQKKENWIRDVCPQTEDEMEARIVDILKARYKRMEEWIKFKVNTVQELCDMFGQEYIWKLWKAVQVEAKKRFNL